MRKNKSQFGDFDSGSGADLIVPISRNVDLLNDGLRLEFENSTVVKSKDFKIPRNVYRAMLEVYVSFHENNESWYANSVNEYVSLNNLSVPGNGAFRGVVVSLDEMVAGAVWPFTVIYTGGANPLFWRPIGGIGSFDLPSYDIEITPLLGKILDGSSHKFSFRVTDALNVWYVDANLYLWLDGESMKTEGKSLKCSCSTLPFYRECRSIILTGMVKSSYGTITTKSSQGLSYISYMVMGNEGNLQIVDQIIEFNDTVYAAMPSSSVYSLESFKKYLFQVVFEQYRSRKPKLCVSNVTLELEDKRVKSFEYGSFVSAVNSLQKAEGYMIVKGLASTRQVYDYNDDSCGLHDTSR
ncbi:Peptide-N4-(N-acetyl-beta-glucosaminyl)asparagine amidase A [Capsicum annuum]|uniref:Peptide-N4-(N-acetyl-beta-glucosaminyl)asparagine amidase A n=1 Tax=Capsicum annuum TaxID=4072 RepID=A0A2G2YIT3_CAPAN|nr:Peptide-N4-(N-acetyl-beta-glucosaminyl)asparagine amidase A [Capsicum annuum]